MSHYTITPLEKKSIAITYEMFRENDDGSISWFNIEEHYRWGKGFIAEDMEVNLEADQTRIQYCKVDEGEYDGCDLEDPIACYFEFSDDLSDEEKAFIEKCYYDGDPNDDNVPDIGGAAWLYDGTHNWQEEDCYIEVMAPYKVDFCTQDGIIIREVKVRSREEQQTLREQLGEGWYIPTDNALEPEKY
jgi:hypothetical protein